MSIRTAHARALLPLALLLTWPLSAAAQPLVTLDDFHYQGAFRLPADDFGEASLNYAQGPIAYNPDNDSLFIVGHAQVQAIAEFAIPELVNSETLADLNMAAAPLQPFATVLDRAAGGNPESIDRVGGMAYLQGQLIVNGYEYYDAPGDNSLTTCVVRDASDLAGSAVDGYYRFPGVAHASGWLSPVPAEWQDALGGSQLTGHASGVPIIGRLSVGPSAFAFDPADLLGATVPDPLPTVTLLDYSLGQPLHDDLSNDTLQNDLWTHLSRATYGFVPPGTKSYVTIGYSGGHDSGVCYKCTQDDGNLCGGYCSYVAADNYQYYWLFDLDDLIAVRGGQMQPYEVRPYAWGQFPTPFQTTEIGGGAYDPASGRLYLTILAADREQGDYANPPVVVVYGIDGSGGGGEGGGGGQTGGSGGAGTGGAGASAGDSGGDPSDDGGCGCHAAPSETRWAWLLPALSMLLLQRRRR